MTNTINQSRMRGFATISSLGICLLLLITAKCCKKESPIQPSPTTTTTTTTTTASSSSLSSFSDQRSLWTETEEEEILESIRTKLKPHQFDFIDGTTTVSPHQFLHLHHMKTGGTSMDHLIKCTRERLETSKNWTVPYHTIHECHRWKFRHCLQNATNPCREPMRTSAIVNYCASLKHLDLFGWDKEDEKFAALTVLRHPVERVWSMFRFEPRECYRCKNLTFIYDLIDANTTDGYDSLCLAQLQNHEVVNMLRHDPHDYYYNDEDAMVEAAINNLKSFFTVVGLTERLKDTNELLGQVFPWMAMEIEGSDTICKLPHDNSSPTNNHCIMPKFKGDKSRHWDLPDHPDEETRKAIERHNQMDMRLYEAAVQYFELQMRAFETGEES